MKIVYKLSSVLIYLTFLSGCTMSTAQYQPDFNLVNDLKDSEIQEVAVGDFSSPNSSVDKISRSETFSLAIFR